jgi:hypothetical protein
MDRNTSTVDRTWTYTDANWSSIDLHGFGVEATDGGIGKVDEATNEVGGSYLVVDTGPWIFGKKVLIPAGTIASIDTEEQRIFLSLTKDQIQNAPEFDEARYTDPDYRSTVGTYYGGYDRPAGPDYGADDRTDPIR